MSQYMSILTGEPLVIKVRHCAGEVIARKIPISKTTKLDELEQMIRERFEVTNDKKVELCYQDEDGDEDRIVVSYDDELLLALSQEDIPTFELVIKPKIAGNTFLYPQAIKGGPGEIVDVWIASQYLTVDHALKEDTKAWGTHIYTDDSDIVKVLSHSEKLELSQHPPKYNVVATLRFLPGCIKYIGSTNAGITTQDYGAYGTSYVIDNVRIVPLVPEKNKYL